MQPAQFGLDPFFRVTAESHFAANSLSSIRDPSAARLERTHGDAIGLASHGHAAQDKVDGGRERKREREDEICGHKAMVVKCGIFRYTAATV